MLNVFQHFQADNDIEAVVAKRQTLSDGSNHSAAASPSNSVKGDLTVTAARLDRDWGCPSNRCFLRKHAKPGTQIHHAALPNINPLGGKVI
jgi:hypothetical protein